MSHVQSTTALADLKAELAEAGKQVATSLADLTDCRTAIAAASFATP